MHKVMADPIVKMFAAQSLVPRGWLVAWLLTFLGLATPMEAAVHNQVAVLDFKLENPTPTTSERVVGLEDFFEVALQKQDVPVLERRNIRLVLAERALQGTGLSVETLSRAKLPTVDFFVMGDVTFPSTGGFTLTLSIIRADDSTVEATLTRHDTYYDDWLPAMESLVKEVREKMQLPKRTAPERSEFEMITWLPEAALSFFKGLDYFSHGDYATAVPWFRNSYQKDRHFNLARLWEARAYTKLGLTRLANLLSDESANSAALLRDSKRQMVAIAASDKLSPAERAAFVQTLRDDGQLELFDPSAIGATAREIDLQLTGQMAAPLKERSVWLVVDDLIYLDSPDSQTLVAREQNLLSGTIVRQATIRTANIEGTDCAALAREFLKSKESTPSSRNEILMASPGPQRQESARMDLPKALRLVQAEPDDARRWIALADCYGDQQFKGPCLDEAVNAVGRNRTQPDAAHWLASALWRKREMSRRIFYEPTPRLSRNYAVGS